MSEIKGRIQLDDNWYIESDFRCTTLYYEEEKDEVNDKGNKVISKDRFYCSSLKFALKSYLNKTVTESDTIQDVIDRIDKVENKIDTWCKQIR